MTAEDQDTAAGPTATTTGVLTDNAVVGATMMTNDHGTIACPTATANGIDVSVPDHDATASPTAISGSGADVPKNDADDATVPTMMKDDHGSTESPTATSATGVDASIPNKVVGGGTVTPGTPSEAGNTNNNKTATPTATPTAAAAAASQESPYTPPGCAPGFHPPDSWVQRAKQRAKDASRLPASPEKTQPEEQQLLESVQYPTVRATKLVHKHPLLAKKRFATFKRAFNRKLKEKGPWKGFSMGTSSISYKCLPEEIQIILSKSTITRQQMATLSAYMNQKLRMSHNMREMLFYCKYEQPTNVEPTEYNEYHQFHQEVLKADEELFLLNKRDNSNNNSNNNKENEYTKPLWAFQQQQEVPTANGDNLNDAATG